MKEIAICDPGRRLYDKWSDLEERRGKKPKDGQEKITQSHCTKARKAYYAHVNQCDECSIPFFKNVG
jgi:hypothetical protein